MVRQISHEGVGLNGKEPTSGNKSEHLADLGPYGCREKGKDGTRKTALYDQIRMADHPGVKLLSSAAAVGKQRRLGARSDQRRGNTKNQGEQAGGLKRQLRARRAIIWGRPTEE